MITKERKFVATIVSVNNDEVYTRYYHNDKTILEEWVNRPQEGFVDSPDFRIEYGLNPLWVE